MWIGACWMRDLTTSKGMHVQLAKKDAMSVETKRVGVEVGAQPVRSATATLASEVIARSVPLRVAARRMVGVAPFHRALAPSSRATRTSAAARRTCSSSGA